MSTTTKGARGAKSKQPKVTVFHLPSDKLSKWAPQKPTSSASPEKESPEASPPTPVQSDPSPADVKKEEPDAESTPNGSAKLEVPTDGRKKGNGGPRGTKRSAAALGDGFPKPRAKPGPKKRKLDGPLASDEAGRPWTTPAPISGQKLGPKANQGAINAGLRALRAQSGKPCRRWTKKGFSVKSFTGVTWSLSTWAAPSRQPTGGEAGAENGTSNSNSNSELQPAQSSSNVGSDTSRNVAPESKEANGSPPVVATPA